MMSLFTVVAFIAVILYLYWSQKTLKDGDLEKAWDAANKAKDLLKEVIAFMTPDDPVAATSKETIASIPENSYKMSAESKARLLEQVDDSAEKTYILEYIAAAETGVDPTEYTLMVGNRVYKVQWGVPELIGEMKPSYLTQTQLADLHALCESENVSFFAIMNEVYANLGHECSNFDIRVGTKWFHFDDGEILIE